MAGETSARWPGRGQSKPPFLPNLDIQSGACANIRLAGSSQVVLESGANRDRQLGVDQVGEDSGRMVVRNPVVQVGREQLALILVIGKGRSGMAHLPPVD